MITTCLVVIWLVPYLREACIKEESRQLWTGAKAVLVVAVLLKLQTL
jgi:hypothetical protein